MKPTIDMRIALLTGSAFGPVTLGAELTSKVRPPLPQRTIRPSEPRLREVGYQILRSTSC